LPPDACFPAEYCWLGKVRVHMLACGLFYTVVVTEEGAV